MTVYAQDLQKKGKKIIKRFGLEPNEVYHISKKNFFTHFGDSTNSASFPVNFLYNVEGKEMRFLNRYSGVVFSPFMCFETMITDLDTVMIITVMDTVNGTCKMSKSIAIDSLAMDWSSSYTSLLYDYSKSANAKYHMYIFFFL